ncbi:hypothetical protein ABBQ32_002594 [Trebouxia sp. C0010 RCD-2024]
MQSQSMVHKSAFQGLERMAGEDVHMWLYGFEKLARMSSWNDQEAIDFAEQAMRLKARAHFKKKCSMTGELLNSTV